LLPGGGFLVTERNPGHLRHGNPNGELSAPVEGVPDIFRFEGDTDRSQAGLFDVRLHPEFAENRLVYLSYSRPTDHGAALAISRGRLSDDARRIEDVEDIFVMKEEDQSSDALHFGGRMIFDEPNEALFLTIGDRRNLSRAQDLEDQAGSVLRMSWDGEPMGAESARANDENDEELDDYVWSWGHRNPQGLAINPEDGQLWLADHGPKGGDELNPIEQGGNYGWPHYTAGVDYSEAPIGHDSPPEGKIAPWHAFEETVAPSGLAFYDGDMFPRWQGHLLVGGLITEGIVRVAPGDDESHVAEEEKMLTDLGRRIRDVQIAADGAIWVITEHEDGEVKQLSIADRQ